MNAICWHFLIENSSFCLLPDYLRFPNWFDWSPVVLTHSTTHFDLSPSSLVNSKCFSSPDPFKRLSVSASSLPSSIDPSIRGYIWSSLAWKAINHFLHCGLTTDLLPSTRSFRTSGLRPRSMHIRCCAGRPPRLLLVSVQLLLLAALLPSSTPASDTSIHIIDSKFENTFETFSGKHSSRFAHHISSSTAVLSHSLFVYLLSALFWLWSHFISNKSFRVFLPHDFVLAHTLTVGFWLQTKSLQTWNSIFFRCHPPPRSSFLNVHL